LLLSTGPGRSPGNEETNMSGCCGNDGEGRRPGRRTLTLLGVAGVLAGGLGLALTPGIARAGGDCCGKDGAAKPADAPAEAKGLLVDLGNAKCPIMGGKPDGETWSEWNGLRVGHCCGGCVKKFAADPAAALDAAGIAWKDAAAAVKKVNDAKTPEDRALAMKELRAKWTVAREDAKPSLLVDLGNAKCPVMGGKPDGKSFSVWNGLRVGHCCPMCTVKFMADPEAALKKAGIEWKDAAAALKTVADAKTPEERSKALAALKRKWTVVEPAKEAAPEPKK
jgi:hypothetical protein